MDRALDEADTERKEAKKTTRHISTQRWIPIPANRHAVDWNNHRLCYTQHPFAYISWLFWCVRSQAHKHKAPQAHQPEAQPEESHAAPISKKLDKTKQLLNSYQGARFFHGHTKTFVKPTLKGIKVVTEDGEEITQEEATKRWRQKDEEQNRIIREAEEAEKQIQEDMIKREKARKEPRVPVVYRYKYIGNQQQCATLWLLPPFSALVALGHYNDQMHLLGCSPDKAGRSPMVTLKPSGPSLLQVDDVELLEEIATMLVIVSIVCEYSRDSTHVALPPYLSPPPKHVTAN
eukprot:1180050-Prorocentrum_minimum.AAC.2